MLVAVADRLRPARTRSGERPRFELHRRHHDADHQPVTLPTVPATNLDGSAVTTPATTPGAGTTATTKKKKTTTTTAAAVEGARPNDQVVVQVLNGSGIQGAATTRSNDLKAQGYQTVPAGNAPSQRTGTGVQCKAGLREGSPGPCRPRSRASASRRPWKPFANPLPAGFDASANCYVLLGK